MQVWFDRDDMRDIIDVDSHDAYSESTYTAESGDKYSIFNVYVLYNDNDIFYCTRKRDRNDLAHGIAGIRSKLMSREEKYIYYDISTGSEICSTDDKKGYEVKRLDDFYNEERMSENGYNIDAAKVTEDMANYILAEEKPMRR